MLRWKLWWLLLASSLWVIILKSVLLRLECIVYALWGYRTTTSQGRRKQGGYGGFSPPNCEGWGAEPPPKLKLTPLLRTLNFDIATWKWQVVGTFAVEFFRCICSLILWFHLYSGRAKTSQPIWRYVHCMRRARRFSGWGSEVYGHGPIPACSTYQEHFQYWFAETPWERFLTTLKRQVKNNFTLRAGGTVRALSCYAGRL